MKFVNLTPHDVRIRLADSMVAEPLDTDIVLSQQEIPLRIEESVVSQEVVDGVTIRLTEFGEIVDLPDPVPGTMLIVSMATAQQAYALGRRDVVAPDTGEDSVIRFKLPNGKMGTYAVRFLRYIKSR